MNEKLQQMVRELGRSLLEAVSDSPEASRHLRRMREQGFSLYFLVDYKREDGVMEAVELTSRSLPEPEPAFQINGNDLSFLKSIGIDPTRKSRRRKSGSRGGDAGTDAEQL